MTRDDSRPSLHWAWLLGLFIAIGLLRVGLAHWVPSPYIFCDELIYAKLARSLDTVHTLLLRGTVYNFPTILYSIALMPAEAVADPHLAYRLVQVTNAVLMTSAAWPTYLLGRRLLDARGALALALISQALPFTLYAHVAMAESLFWPLAMWTAYLTLHALEHDGRGWKVALGIVLGAIFMTKPQGLLFPPAVIMAALATWQPGWGYRGLLQRLGSFWPAIAVFLGALLLQLVRINWMLQASNLLDPSHFLGTYSGGLGSDAVRPFLVGVFLHSVAGNLGAVAMAVGFLPVPLAAVFAWHTLKAGTPRERAFLAFSLTFGLLCLWMTARIATQFDDPNRIHERYTFYLEPLVLAGALVALERWRGRAWPLVAASALALAGSTSFFAQALGTSIITDSPTYAALWRASLRYSSSQLVVGALLLGVAFLVGLGWLLPSDRRGWIAPALGLYAVVLTGFAFVCQHAISNSFASRFAYVEWVTSHANHQPTLVLLDDGQIFLKTFIADFFARQTVLPYFLRFNPDRSTHLPLTLTADGQLLELSRLPEGTPMAAKASGLLLDQPLLARQDDDVIYAKRGRVHLAGQDDRWGRREDGWTNGHFRDELTVRDPRALHAHFEGLVDVSEMPARLMPYPLRVRDGVGPERTLWLRAGQKRVPLAFDLDRRPGKPFVLTLEGPTWVPANEHKFADASTVAIKLRWAVILPVWPAGSAGRP